jgi:short-subunit dehydrogenase
MKSSRVVLITGCSTGIGRALSEEFHRRGHRVMATARRIESLHDLKAKGMSTFRLDVTDREEARRVVNSILLNEQHIDILVNNAGFGLIGPALDIPEEELVGQFQANVVGPHTMTRLVAPSMRTNGGGMIVNIGSISGLVTTPFAGGYCASKAALHALSDAFRMELEPFGIRVVTVQPGGIASNFGITSGKSVERILKQDSWFAPLRKQIEARAGISQIGALGSGEFASRLIDILESPKPPAIVRLGKRSFTLPFIKWALPTSLYDRAMKKQFGLDQLS